MKILILEQEQIVKKDIEQQLLKNGFEIVKDCRTEMFDVVIIGQLFYFEEIKRIRKDLAPHVRFFFITTQKEDASINDTSISERSVFISKPVDAETLIGLINFEHIR
jgi:DNA-binding NarL/FixJ family response regulator